jgi:hypothetical protein
MSAVKLIKIGNKTIPSPQGTRQYKPVLLSDSKGITLKQERYDPIHTEIKWMCESGTNTTGTINTLRSNLINLIQEHWLYVWIGTCDLTQLDASTRCISLKSSENNTVIQKLKSETELIYEILNQYPGNKITFLELPFYSIVKWNSVHNHK